MLSQVRKRIRGTVNKRGYVLITQFIAVEKRINRGVGDVIPKKSELSNIKFEFIGARIRYAHFSVYEFEWRELPKMIQRSLYPPHPVGTQSDRTSLCFCFGNALAFLLWGGPQT